MGKVIGGIKSDDWLKWCNSLEVANLLEEKFKEMFGDKEVWLINFDREVKVCFCLDSIIYCCFTYFLSINS